MAVRIRKNRQIIICAAKSDPQDGDCYIDDNLHYVLGVELCVLSVCSYDSNGADLWEFHFPITMDKKVHKEEKVRMGNEDV